MTRRSLPSGVTVASLTLSLAALISVIRLGSSLYLPALSKMETEMHIPDHDLAATMSVYFVFFAVAALLAGPVADARGRRPLMIGGLLCFIAGTVMCALAQGLNLLMGGRILQAIGGSAIPVVGRAMIGDTCDEDKIVEVMGLMGVLNSLTPILAPILGGVLTQFLGWRSNFYFLLIVTVVVAIYSWRNTPETLAVQDRAPMHLGFVLRSFASMLASPVFMGPLLPAFFCFALQGAYLSMAPFIFIRQLHLSSMQFGLTTLPLVLAMVVGRSLCMAWLRRSTAERVFVGSGVLILLSAIWAGLVAQGSQQTVAGLLSPTILFCVGLGTMLPLGLRAVMLAYAHLGGTASALNTSLTLAASAIGSLIGSWLLAQPMSEYQSLCWANAACGPVVLISCVLFRKWVK